MVENLGDSAKRQKEIPRIEPLGIVAKRQKVIPKDIMEKVRSNLTVKEYIMRTLIEGRRQTHGTDRPCCVGSDCHLVVHLNSLLGMEIMLAL